MKELPRNHEERSRTNWRDAVAAYTEPRVLQVLALGFSSGLPLLLTYSTLSAWLATAGVKRAAIGTFALVGTPYAFKFLWAPLMDRVPPPLPLGRRRGWGITIQILLIGAVLGLGLCDPKHNLPRMAALAVVVAFLSASQDIVIEAWRVESLKGDQQAPGAAMDSGRLPGRHAGCRCRRPVDRSVRRVVRGLCHNGGARRCGNSGVFAGSRTEGRRRKLHTRRDQDGMRFATRFRPP